MIFWLNETIWHFKEEAHILSGATCCTATLSVMRLSVIWLLCYKIWPFPQLVSCKPNNLWHLYGWDNQLLDRQPFPPKSIIQTQSSDQNRSNGQRSLQPDGCLVTGMKWVCGFTQGIIVRSRFMGKKKKKKKKTSSQLITFSVLCWQVLKRNIEVRLNNLFPSSTGALKYGLGVLWKTVLLFPFFEKKNNQKTVCP